MKLIIPAFHGLIPRLSPRMLPPGGAQTAENCKLYSGELDSFRRTKLVFTSAKKNVQSAYRMYSGSTDVWLTWNDDVDAARGPIAGDTSFRLYYTGDTTGQGWPKKTSLALATSAGDYPGDYLEMGYPRPTTPTLGTAGGTGTNVTVSYFYTLYSSTWDEEGPPSDPVSGTYKVDGTWTLTTGTTVPGPSIKYAVDQKRVYRTITGASGLVSWNRVATIGLGTATYADDRTVNTDAVIAANPVCPSIDVQGAGVVTAGSQWDAPPTGMIGFCAGANGMAAGFYANVVCFAEPYKWHAWPTRYQYTLPWAVVWAGFAGNVLYVATKGRPYAFVGNHPAAMNQVQVERDDMPCVSKRSGAVASGGALFATKHGLAAIGPGSGIYVTEKLALKDEWSAFFPSTMIAKAYNDRYIGFFDTGAGKKGIFLDPQEQLLNTLNQSVTGLYVDPETALLYLLSNDGVSEWEGDANNLENRDYLSGIYVLPKPVNLAWIEVDGDFSALGGSFAEEQAQLAADLATNQALLATLTENWSLQTAGKIKAELNSHIFGGLTPESEGPAGSNNHGIVCNGSLLVGGVYSTYANRFLLATVYGYDYDAAAWIVLWSEYLATSQPQRMNWEGKYDLFQVRLQGNIRVRPPVRLAETTRGLREV